ncbi:related to Regulatory protein SWI6 [Zygosaccharomyces bailii]|nr:related to Regulatory protein SWI6 [Zygosaccharomyces bailii]
MSVVEVTKYIGEGEHQTPLTLKRSNETGYFLLKPFLPLLQRLVDTNGEGDATIDDVNNTEIAVQQEDRLLSKYGILVDTDESNEKWITGEKAFELMQMLDILHLFKEEFESQPRNGDNEHSPMDADGVDTTLATHYSPDGTGTDDDTRPTGSHSGENNTEQPRDGPHKRVNNELGMNLEAQRELGSPLKRLRLDKHSPQDETMGSFAPADVKPVEVASSSRTITTFDHDMDSAVLTVPLSIKRTKSPPVVSDNNQRMKLEAFLQRLLFPEVQDLSSTSHDTHHMSFESLLHEVDLTFPDVPLNLNVPVDEHGNTPLHWLASIANLEVVKQLVKNGSDRFLGDNIGESALVKAVKSVNNYDSGTFEELLDYLYPCLILEDTMNRTILHHIVITSGMTGCSSAAKYYLDIFMGWIVKKQSRPIEGAGTDSILDTLDLKWVIANMLNAPDSNGDTCLNIASRLGNVAIVDALLDYGADPYVANKSGLRPVDFGAGTSKLLSNGISSTAANHITDSAVSSGVGEAKIPDTMSLIEDMQSLLNTVSKDYNTEVKDHQEKLDKLHKDLNMYREMLATCRDRLAHAKQLQDEHALLKEQLANIKKGIQDEEENFRQESKQLGISADDDSGADWDSSEFDADEPFRVDFIYDILENKLANEYGGNIEKLLDAESIDTVLKQVRSSFLQNGDDKLESMLPPSFLLKARINAYKKNDERLNSTIDGIKQNQSALESKFRRVLCLCLKVDEDKVDGMLDGLLQAISSEDPQDVDTEEMQDFLKKHAV